MPFCISHMVAACRSFRPFFSALVKGAIFSSARFSSQNSPTSLKKACTARPPFSAELAADEVERLDAVGAFVDHGDAGIAHELAHAVLFDVAVAAEHLLRHDGVVEALVGEHALDHRRHQADVVVGRLALLVVAGAVGDVGLDRRPQQPARGRPR